MVVRRPRNEEAAKKTTDRIWKIETRIYILWALGIAVGALQLKPTGFSVIGATFALEKPELIEGLLFIGCLAYYVLGFYLSLLAPYVPAGLGSYRKAIWFAATRRGGTLKDVADRKDLWRIKLNARIGFRLAFWVAVVGALLPLLHIVLFRREPLWAALKLILANEI